MTDKKNKMDALLLQVQVMSSVLDNIGSYVYSKDLNGKYTYVNSDVSTLFKMPIKDIIGKDDSYFFDLDIFDELRQNDLKVLRD
jgi:transcriptional regulator with PAS, ATPase and Fis domain